MKFDYETGCYYPDTELEGARGTHKEIPLYLLNFDVMPSDIVVDLGMYIGMFGRYCMSKGVENYYGFEAHKNYYDIAKRNLDPSYNIFNYMINDEVEDVVYEYWGHSEDKRTVGFLDAINQCDIKKINVLKMDIEGYEYNLFKDNKIFDFLITSVDKMVFEIHGVKQNYEYIVDLIRMFENSGYKSDVRDVVGLCVKDGFLNNFWYANVESHARDWYNELVIYFWKN